MPYTVAGGDDYVAGTSIVMRKTGTYWQTDESLVYPGSVAHADVIEFGLADYRYDIVRVALRIGEGKCRRCRTDAHEACVIIHFCIPPVKTV